MFLVPNIDTHLIFFMELIVSFVQMMVDVYNIFYSHEEVPISSFFIQVNMFLDVHFTHRLNWHIKKKKLST